MAYTKYKEITKYFNFYKEIDSDDLPQYAQDYIEKDETIYAAYSTKRDRGVFTDKKILLFDVNPIQDSKQVYIIPYRSISTIAILFKSSTVSLICNLNNPYPLELKFVKMTSDDKTKLRILYTKMSKLIEK